MDLREEKKGTDLFFFIGGPRTGPSHARAENGVFQPGDSLASGNGLKENPFTGQSEVENSLCEKSRLEAENLSGG